MLYKAAANGLIRGSLPQVVPGGVISLQYADDTILFLDNDVSVARILKWFLSCFEQMSGMRINYHKSDLMTINVEPEDAKLFAQIFCCKLAGFPFKYLGVPLHYSKLSKEDLQPIIDKLIKRIAGWRGRLLNIKSRLVLLKACLASIPLYLMSVLKFPKWAIRLINSQMSHFLWNDTVDARKYHLANWDLVCLKREFGSLGVQNLRDFILCLLASWVKRYNLDANKIWRKIVDFKYDLSPISFPSIMHIVHLSEKGSGLLMQLR
jgi:hypothetical protein